MKNNECKIYFNETLKCWVTQQGDGFYAKDIDYNRRAISSVRKAQEKGLRIVNQKEMDYHISQDN